MVEGAALCAIGLHPALTLKCIEPDIINFAARESLRLTGFIAHNSLTSRAMYPNSEY